MGVEAGTMVFAALASAKYALDSLKTVRETVATWKNLDREFDKVQFQKEHLRLEKELLAVQAEFDGIKTKLDDIEKAWHTRTKGERTAYGCYLIPGEPIPYCGKCLDGVDHKHYQVNRTGMMLWCAQCGTKYSPPTKPGRMGTSY